MAFFLSGFMSFWCKRENARRDELSPELKVDELTEEQKGMERELADSVPWFRYTC